ncbi:class I SAM-dependent methyltransferase [Acidithiobacillus sp. MC6.1]|nr:class I SAM-dependent methyltransferase [Acidithiobacillus sp. MC6.1]
MDWMDWMDGMDGIAYTGRDNLDVMDLAVRYNESIFQDMLRCFGSSTDPDADPDESGSRNARTILDFGAGKGRFARRLQAMGFTMRCVEDDPLLAGEIVAYGLPVEISLGLLPDASVDALYAINVLEHIADDQAMLEDWWRVLRPGGHLYLYVPAFPLLYSSMDRKVGHYRRYKKAPLTQLLRDCGFTVSMSRYVDSIGFAASLAYRLIGPDDGVLSARSVGFYDRWIFPFSQWLDQLAHPIFGKNVVIWAKKAKKAKKEGQG